jgi:hypothetical protein
VVETAELSASFFRATRYKARGLTAVGPGRPSPG